MQLFERQAVLLRLESALTEAREGHGRAVPVRGEAGIGKTSAVRAFSASHQEDAHVLWGGCDDLLTARPLGPIWDIALDEPALGEALCGEDRYEVFNLLLELLTRALRPTLIVIEVHPLGRRGNALLGQVDVLRHLTEDMTNAEIADRLFVSSRTVDHHVSAILGKLGVLTRSEAVAVARDAGMIDSLVVSNRDMGTDSALI